MSDPFHDAVDQLRDAGIENPRREAGWILKRAMGLKENDALPLSGAKPSVEEQSVFETLVARRATREPLQHVLGDVNFFGYDLKTDARALIPRWDSECVVELALERLNEDKTAKIADLGTGSGALLSALLLKRPNLTGIAVERCPRALELAKENFSDLGLYDRMICFEGSWSDWEGWRECDLIISNPPYIRSEEIPTLQPEVKDFEPKEALDGGPDGLNAYREMIDLAAKHMKPGAHMVLEIGHDQKEAVSDLLKTQKFSDLAHKKDLGGNDRAIAASKH